VGFDGANEHPGNESGFKRKQSLMQLPSSVKHKQGLVSTLSTLYQRHTAVADAYQSLGKTATKDMAQLTTSLAAYHQEQAANLMTVISDFPDTPVSPNKQMCIDQEGQPPLAETDLNNPQAAFQRFHDEEECLHREYKHLLGNDTLPAPIIEKIETQHRRVQEVMQKLQRMARAGTNGQMKV
jgi:hypothetical protein